MLKGYPKDQCEAWLGAIHKKYKKLEEEPHYWECLAALEEARGNITNAVEYYRNAIVQGAEVSYFNSLFTTFKMMCLLC